MMRAMRSLLSLLLLLPLTQAQTALPTNTYYSTHGNLDGKCQLGNCVTRADTCPIGQYLLGCATGATIAERNAAAGACTGCTNVLPPNAEWITRGGQIATGCTWQCTSNFKLVAGACVPKQCAEESMGAVTNSEFLAGAQGQFPNCKYQCSAGYIPSGLPNTRGPSNCGGCAAGTAAAVEATTCTPCNAGFFSAANAGVCTACPTGTFTTANGKANNCDPCTNCITGSFKSGCGGANAGSCSTCSNTAYP